MLQELYLDYLAKNKKIIILYLICLLFIFPLKNFGISKLYGKLFSSIKKNNFSNNLDFSNIFKFPNIIFLIIFVWLIIIIANYVKNFLESSIFPSFIKHIRTTIFSRTIKGHEKKFKNLLIGKEIASVIEISNQSKNVIDLFSKYWIPLFYSLIIINIYFYLKYPKLFVAVFITTLITISVIYFYSKECIELARLKYLTFLDANEKLNDNYSNLMNIYINNQQNNSIINYNLVEKKKEKKDHLFLLKNSQLIFIVNVVSLSSFFITLYLSYKMFISSEINKEELIFIVLVLFSYYAYLLDSANILPKVFDKIGVIKTELENFEKLTKKKEQIKNNYIIKNGSIEFRNVTFKYPDQKTNKNIINRINFTINAKEKVSLIGCSGCGKTTIIKLLLNMYKINYGKILIDNENITKYNTQYLREQVNYINQKTLLFNESIIENIKKGNTVNNNQILKLLKLYNLEIVFNKLPKGIYSIAGVNGQNLSIGMQKVTIILRGMLKQGKIIILDEPLAGLDKYTRIKIIKLIKNVCRDKTLIIITHNKEISSLVNRTIDIKDI